MLILNQIRLSGSTEEKLDKIIEDYNSKHEEKYSYQDLCEYLLKKAIREYQM